MTVVTVRYFKQKSNQHIRNMICVFNYIVECHGAVTTVTESVGMYVNKGNSVCTVTVTDIASTVHLRQGTVT